MNQPTPKAQEMLVMPSKKTKKKQKDKDYDPPLRRRSDGQGLRYPAKITITDDNELTLVTAKGHKLDGRLSVVKEAQKIFAEHVVELGGTGALSIRQRRELEIIVRQILMGRHLLNEIFEDKEDLRAFASSNSDRILLAALHRAYQ